MVRLNRVYWKSSGSTSKILYNYDPPSTVGTIVTTTVDGNFDDRMEIFFTSPGKTRESVNYYDTSISHKLCLTDPLSNECLVLDPLSIIPPPPEYHNVCQNYICTQVSGAGANECGTPNAQCIPDKIRTCDQILSTSTALLQRYDLNKNGRIDSEEIAQVQADYAAGKISAQDMLDLLEYNQLGCFVLPPNPNPNPNSSNVILYVGLGLGLLYFLSTGK